MAKLFKIFTFVAVSTHQFHQMKKNDLIIEHKPNRSCHYTSLYLQENDQPVTILPLTIDDIFLEDYSH